MNVKDFFDLPEDQRDYLFELHRKQRMVRNTRDIIAAERGRLDTREINNQMECEHPFSTDRYVANENEFGNLTGGGTRHHHCPDCGARWTTNK